NPVRVAARQRAQPGREGVDPGADEKRERQAAVGRSVAPLSREQVPRSGGVGTAVRTLALLALILGPAIAAADDYWLQADSYHPPSGPHLVVHLSVGQAFAAREEKAFERAHTERFELRQPNDVHDLLGSTNDGIKPVFDDALPAPGPFLVTMVSGSEQVG